MKKLYIKIILINFIYNNIAISQTPLAEWYLTSNLNPIINIQNISASNFFWSPVTSNISYSATYGAGIGGWTISSEPDSNYYYQVNISPNAGYKIIINSLQFSERRTPSCIRKFKILYSKYADFHSYGTLYIDSFYVNNSSFQSERNHSITGINLNYDTIYLRFFGYFSLSTSSSSKWYLKDIIISGSLSYANTNDLSSYAEKSAFSVPSANFNSLTTFVSNAQPVFKFRIGDKGSGDNKPTKVNQINILNTNNSIWTDNIGGILLKDSANNIILTGNSIISDNEITIPLVPGNLTVNDNSWKEITLNIYLTNNSIDDNAILQFMIDSINTGFIADTTGSGFENNFHEQIISDTFKIVVKATKIHPDSLTTVSNFNNPFFISFSATDENGNIDVDETGIIKLSLVKGNGHLITTYGLTKNIINGYCSWNDLIYDSIDTIIIKVKTNTPDFADSLLVTVFINSVSQGLNESFDDGNFTQNPKWYGDTTLFIIDTTTENNCLELYDWRNPVGSSAYTCTPINISLNKIEWEFYTKMEFNLSTYLKTYLIADNSDLNNPLNGYYLKIYKQSSTTYKIDLYKQSGSSSTILGSDTVPFTDNQTFRLKVIRKDTLINEHNWRVSADFFGNSDFTNQLIDVNDNSVINDKIFNFGFVCKYSSTHRQDFYFDDIYIGQEKIDTTTPKLLNVFVTDETHLKLLFSKPVDSVFSNQTNNYCIQNNDKHPLIAQINNDTLNIIKLTFNFNFQPDSFYILKINKIRDFVGNETENIFVTVFYHKVKPHDIEINEIMANPTNAHSLPDYEYIELYNKSDYPVDLSGWTLKRGTNKAQIISEKSYLLPADSFLIMTSNLSSNPYLSYRYVIGLSSFTLLNGGEPLNISNSKGEIISYINYSDKWYNPSSKDTGGWSLEQINPQDPCGENTNWKASVDFTGGTPGRQNSVFSFSEPENVNTKVIRATVINNKTIKVFFSEPLDSLQASDINNYIIDNNVGVPLTALPKGPDFKTVVLSFRNDFEKIKIYLLTVSDFIHDCTGNQLSINYNTCSFGLPDTILPNDIVVNEILFNPLPGGYDFVELYNKSNKTLDLKNLFFSYKKNSSDTTATITSIQSGGYLIFSNEYVAITENPDAVKSQYYTPSPDNFVIPDVMPDFNIESGIVKIADNSNIIIDEFSYNQSMHFPLLKDTKGVSLERINYNRDSNDPTNWHSASAAVGFATPAYQNSEFNNDIENNDIIKIEPDIFSPDNDGYNDVLNIHYKINEPGWVANIKIFDSKGRLEKYLLKNELIGTEGTFSWDGINDKNQKSLIGMYILYFELFDLNKKIKKIKKPFVLAGKLN